MSATGFMARLNSFDQQACLIWKDKTYSYADLQDAIEQTAYYLRRENIKPGAVVEIFADFSLQSVALLFALLERQCIIVPTTQSVQEKREKFQQLAQVQHSVSIDDNDIMVTQSYTVVVNHPLYSQLRAAEAPGLVLFSSGSTGEPKAAVHDMNKLLSKFVRPKPAKRIINFLLFDHIGGLNTLFHTLCSGGCVITLAQRQPSYVCQIIEKHRAQILPTSPTFLNLLLLDKAYQQHSLESLELISYGTETMPASTLQRLHQLFPKIKLIQTYGLSETGILSVKSKSSDSLLLKVNAKDVETRIIDNVLQIKSSSAMLGYLNAANPLTHDGWFITGDVVQQQGEYLKILGRKSEIINVGGEKVYPAEVESILQLMPGVLDVVVRGESNALLGQIVTAELFLSYETNTAELTRAIKTFCQGKLNTHAIPQKVVIAKQSLFNARYKRIRKTSVAMSKEVEECIL